MLKRVCCGFVPLLAGFVCLLVAHAETGVGGTGCCGSATPTKAACVANCVCPIYRYAVYPTFCSYYSQNCSTKQYVSLDTSCSITCPDFCNNKIECVGIGSFKEKGGTKHPSHTHDPKLMSVKKQPPVADPIPGPSKTFASRIGEPILAYLHTTDGGTTKAKVQLNLFLIKPTEKDHPPRIFATGIEVDTNHPATLTIPYSEIVYTENQICHVELGSVTYRVILDENTNLTKKSRAKSKEKNDKPKEKKKD